MAFTITCGVALSGIFAFFVSAHALQLAGEHSQGIEDEAISFMQSSSAMSSGPRRLLVQASAGLNDAASLAQEVVEVISPVSPPVLGPFSVSGLAGDGEEEDATCSLEGLTPGVCAMKALAQPARADAATDLDFRRPERLEHALFAELEAALAGTHRGFTDSHLEELRREMASFFAALPKNEDGRLAHPTVRYALHQHFLREHAWYIRSLNPVGEAQAETSPGELLRSQVPEHLLELLERREENRGLGSREMAALIATLEHLIKGDMGERLKAAYATHGFRANSTVEGEEAVEVLMTFMAHFLSLEHRDGYSLTPEQAQHERRQIETRYPGWSIVVAAARTALAARNSPHTFAQVLAAAQEVMKAFEALSAQDCLDMKEDLSNMPEGDSGSVRLTDLRRKAVEDSMLFAESTEYLGTLGALDESEQDSPRVLVPNYVYSPSNCLGTTSFFEMCCPNECEVLLRKLENELKAPDVTSAQVASVLTTVSASLLAELDTLAALGGGAVPMHGLGFAEWMHHAFPLECPRPRAEDFKGARAGSEVPTGEGELQQVAQVKHMVASRGELYAELEEAEHVVPIAPTPNVLDHELEFEDLKALAAEELATSGRGLKVPISKFVDATFFGQTQLEVGGVAEEEPTSPTRGLKFGRAPSTGPTADEEADPLEGKVDRKGFV
mmetsp:Transcript_47254/g.109335  ORF Transcript_47254/g.109335 Transcript_47254/m.109335 type:complete len:672 (+) Transcript_47254:57-2072(+)